MDKNEERIIELEEKLSYQEDLIQDLNQLVVSQQQQIDKLLMLSELLKEQFAEIVSSLPETPPGNEVPPHY